MTNLRNCILLVLQLTAIYNAKQLGWNVEVATNKKIILKKKLKDMTVTDHNTTRLIEVLMNLKKTPCY